MNVDYRKILRRSFQITKNHKRLWFFGLFLTGWLPVFAMVGSTVWVSDGMMDPYRLIRDWFLSQPDVAKLGLIGLGIVCAVIALLLISIARLLLLLVVGDAEKKFDYQIKRLRIEVVTRRRQISYLFYIGVVTSLCLGLGMLVVMFPLLGPPHHGFDRLVTLAGALTFVFSFACSCVNVFAAMGVVYYRVQPNTGIPIGIDLFRKKWPELAILGSVLVLTHVAVLLAAQVVWFIITGPLWFILHEVMARGVFSPLAVVLIKSGTQAIIFWLFAAVYSVFFNTALILFFFETIEDIKDPEFAPVISPQTTI